MTICKTNHGERQRACAQPPHRCPWHAPTGVMPWLHVCLRATLAKALSRLYQAAHLDLDTIAWTAEPPGVRADVQASTCALMRFIESAGNWVIEGCYAGLLRAAAPHCTEMIFLNPGIEACVENCRARPWEPHKYENLRGPGCGSADADCVGAAV
jgi:hypothetical protein